MNQWQKDAITQFRFTMNALRGNGQHVSKERQTEVEKLVMLTGGRSDRDKLIEMLVMTCIVASGLEYNKDEGEYMKTDEWNIMFDSIRENALKEA